MEQAGSGLATFGGGCFWCLEAVFERLRGVTGVVSGYAGGSVDSPSYEEVCSGATGHAEVVQISFEPAIISYQELLDVLFTVHDPTTLNRQGADVGTQYRSVVFYHDEAQRQAAQAKIDAVQSMLLDGRQVVTELQPAAQFYPAEQYHQGYYRAHTNQPYCQMVVAGKVAKASRAFPERWQP